MADEDRFWDWGWLLPKASVWPPGIVVACICLCVRVSVITEFVCAITRHPFKLGSPNLDHTHKIPWFRSLLFCGVIDLDIQGQIERKTKIYPILRLSVLTHHPFKPGPPNLEQRCKIPWSILFGRWGGGRGWGWGWPPGSILTWKVKISSFTASRAWLFHGLHPLYVIIYLERFTVLTLSQSQSSSRILDSRGYFGA